MRSIVALFITLLLSMSVRAEPEAALLAAHYRVALTGGEDSPPRESDWYLWREANRVETDHPADGLAEVWERDERGELSLRRVFHADRRVLEYSGGELRARGADSSWEALGSVVDPALLKKLERAGAKSLPEGEAVVYRGTADGEQIEIWWLEKLRLPARMTRTRSGSSFTLALQSVRSDAPQDWPRVEEAAIAEYLLIDAADLGDMHYDAFAQRVEHYDSAAGALGAVHGGHAH